MDEVISRLFDALDQGVVILQPNGSVRDWNAAALAMLRVTAEQLCGKTPLDAAWRAGWEGSAADRETRDPLRAMFARARERGSAVVSIMAPEEPPRWLALTSHVVDGDDGELVVCTLADVTAQRSTERENARYREIIGTLDASHRIVEESPIGMCSVDANGNVLRSNMAFLALGGIEATSIFALIAREDRATLRHEFDRLLAGSIASVRIETRVHDASDSDGWYEITAVVMRQGMPDAAILVLFNDITERRRRELRLRQLAERDPLTGLHNRRSFERTLRARLASLERPRRGCGEWSLMMIDLDGFKEVNDTCGHAGGDAVLVAVAAGIRDRTRIDDTVGRLGGDEFAVLFCSELADAVGIGEQIIARVADAARTVSGAPPVTASVGIVRLRPGRKAHQVLEAADEAMYRAKRLGKSRAVEAAV